MDERDDFETRMRAMQDKFGTDLSRPLPRWIWLVSAAIPLLFVVIGLGFVVDAVQFTGTAQGARGTVIEVEHVPGSKGGVTYRPRIRFQSADGETVVAATSQSSSEYDYDKGAQVDILYDPADPRDMRIDSFFSLYGFGLIFAAFGAVFLVMLMFVRRFIETRPAALAARSAAARRYAPPSAPAAPEPTTDLSKYGHAHKPKPPPEPTVRRNR